MKDKIFVFTGLAAASVILTACPSNEVMESKNIAQSEIHQQYYITYDHNDNMMSVNAEFRAAGPNGTTIVLSEPSDIVCNGKEMKLETYLLGGAHYMLSWNESPLPVNVNIEFIDLDKKTYRNYFFIHPIGIDEQLSSNMNMLKKDKENWITLKTHPLENGENMWLDIEGDSISTKININDGNIAIHPADLKDFKSKEKVSLQITRERSGSITQATPQGGTYTAICRSQKWTATVK